MCVCARALRRPKLVGLAATLRLGFARTSVRPCVAGHGVGVSIRVGVDDGRAAVEAVPPRPFATHRGLLPSAPPVRRLVHCPPPRPDAHHHFPVAVPLPDDLGFWTLKASTEERGSPNRDRGVAMVRRRVSAMAFLRCVDQFSDRECVEPVP